MKLLVACMTVHSDPAYQIQVLDYDSISEDGSTRIALCCHLEAAPHNPHFFCLWNNIGAQWNKYTNKYQFDNIIQYCQELYDISQHIGHISVILQMSYYNIL